MPLLAPTVVFRRASAITPQYLQNRGIRALVLDVDNTLTAHDSQHLPADIAAWLEAMKAAGMQMMIVSNNNAARVAPFAARLGLPFCSMACKPFFPGLARARRAFGVQKCEMALVGDQIYTDVLAANLYGIPMLTVLPMYADSKAGIRFKRRLEAPIFARFYRRGGTIVEPPATPR